MPHGWNAYLPGGPFVSGWLSNSVETNFVFESGPLGQFYLPSGSPLLNRGTNPAPDYGLYHFTSTTNQVKETNSTADVGFHYVALTVAKSPVDSDGDGLPDYTEDENGNGVKDTSETDLASIDSDYDGRSDGQEVLSDDTNPLDSSSAVFGRLAYFPFNDTNWLGSAGQSPVATSNLINADAWLSKALQVNNGSNAFLKYREVESDLNANINLRNGAVRFWFQPSGWNSNGPNGEGRLLEVGSKGAGTTNGWWALYFNTNGSQITFSVQTNNAGTNLLTAALPAWCSKEWHQFVLNFSPSNSALYLDSVLLTNGGGVTLWPGASVRANGFTVGSDANGTNQARGLFEDLETFNYPLSTNEITENFQTNRPPNAIADLKMWLKGEAVSFGVGSSNRITRWIDQTCNNNDGQQTTPNWQPLLSPNELNGKAVVRFYATNFFNLQLFPTNWTEGEAFVVLKAEADSGNHRGLWKIETSGSGTRYPQSDGVVVDNFGRSGTGNPSGRPSLSISQPHLYNVATRPNEWVSRLNGVIHHSTPSNTVGFPASSIQLGINRFSEHFEGYIAEVLFYNRVLNEAERQRVEIYLNQRYALVTNAPPTPTNLAAQAVSPTQASLSWDAVLSNTNVIYTVERQSGGGVFVSVAGLRNGASYLDRGLQTNTAYTYRVKAENWAGPSTYSSEVSVTTSTNGADIPMSALKLWLKADCGRGASPLCFWADQSGSVNHGSQDLVNNRLIVRENTIATNKPVIGLFTTNFFYLRYYALITWTQAEAFVVWRARTYAPADQRGQWHFGSAPANYPSVTTNNVIHDNFFRENNTNATVSPPVDLTLFHLYNPQATSNTWSSRFNGADFFSTSPNSFQVLNQAEIGTVSGKHWDGDIAEILFFNHVLSTDGRTTVENYLNARFHLW